MCGMARQEYSDQCTQYNRIYINSFGNVSDDKKHICKSTQIEIRKLKAYKKEKAHFLLVLGTVEELTATAEHTFVLDKFVSTYNINILSLTHLR